MAVFQRKGIDYENIFFGDERRASVWKQYSSKLYTISPGALVTFKNVAKSILFEEPVIETFVESKLFKLLAEKARTK